MALSSSRQILLAPQKHCGQPSTCSQRAQQVSAVLGKALRAPSTFSQRISAGRQQHSAKYCAHLVHSLSALSRSQQHSAKYCAHLVHSLSSTQQPPADIARAPKVLRATSTCSQQHSADIARAPKVLRATSTCSQQHSAALTLLAPQKYCVQLVHALSSTQQHSQPLLAPKSTACTQHISRREAVIVGTMPLTRSARCDEIVSCARAEPVPCPCRARAEPVPSPCRARAEPVPCLRVLSDLPSGGHAQRRNPAQPGGAWLDRERPDSPLAPGLRRSRRTNGPDA